MKASSQPLYVRNRSVVLRCLLYHPQADCRHCGSGPGKPGQCSTKALAYARLPLTDICHSIVA